MAGPWDRVLMGFKAPKPPVENPKGPSKVAVEKPQKAQRQPRKAPQAKT